MNQAASGFLEKYAAFSQSAGTLLKFRDRERASIASVMFKEPLRPSLRFSDDNLMMLIKPFILLTSWRQTTTNGLNSLILSFMMRMLNSCGVLF